MINEERLVLALLNKIKTDITNDISTKGISQGDLGMTSVLKTGTTVEGELQANHYWYFLWKGRKPGKMPPIEAIKEWLVRKGITAIDVSQNSLAFLIARKIGRLGTDIYLGRKPGMAYEEIIEVSLADFEKQWLEEATTDIEYLLKQKFTEWQRSSSVS